MRGAADDALLAACATGDAEAAATFVRRHQARVYGLALAIVGEPQVALDVARDAFLRAWCLSPAYDPRRAPVLTWLLTLTRSLALDAMRMCRPAAASTAVTGAFGSAGSEDSFHPPRDVAPDCARLVAALASLSQPQRRALALAALGGRSTRDIADAEGVTLSTARARLRSALLRLRSMLAAPRQAGNE